jgi:hypothetical protein
MIEWELVLVYKGKRFIQKATVEYSSRQIMRIRVTGSKGGLLLENNYPAIRFAKAKKGVKWKIREGSLTAAQSDDAILLVNIFSKLEDLMKTDFEKIYPDAELF